VIALRSPHDMDETALAKWLREKTGSAFERSRGCCRFLWCGLCGILAKLPQFVDVSAELQRDSLQRRLDGGAWSPVLTRLCEIPANREKYREFINFCSQNNAKDLLSSSFCAT
jgi:hypothetical protein